MAELLTADGFKEKIHDYSTGGEWNYKGDVPGLIDFYADWCGPCKMIAPIIDELASKFAGKLNVWKVDTDTQQELAMQYNISSIPTLMFIPVKGQPTMSAGAQTKASLEKIIEEKLGVK